MKNVSCKPSVSLEIKRTSTHKQIVNKIHHSNNFTSLFSWNWKAEIQGTVLLQGIVQFSSHQFKYVDFKDRKCKTSEHNKIKCLQQRNRSESSQNRQTLSWSTSQWWRDAARPCAPAARSPPGQHGWRPRVKCSTWRGRTPRSPREDDPAVSLAGLGRVAGPRVAAAAPGTAPGRFCRGVRTPARSHCRRGQAVQLALATAAHTQAQGKLLRTEREASRTVSPCQRGQALAPAPEGMVTLRELMQQTWGKTLEQRTFSPILFLPN